MDIFNDQWIFIVNTFLIVRTQDSFDMTIAGDYNFFDSRNILILGYT